MSARTVRCAFSVALCLVLGRAGYGQPFAKGELLEGIVTAADPSQTYTLYLPHAYDPARTWPLLLVFDPRGESVSAASRFRDAAERFGWILISTNGTRSDESAEPNLKALAAIWPEAHQRVRSDPRRIYLAGYSGTVVLSWLLAFDRPEIAGVIASCGRLPSTLAGKTPRFAQFSATGLRDFNHLPTMQLDAEIARGGAAHRLRTFDGGHEWLPADLAEEAVGWLEVVAMRQELRAKDETLVATLAASDLEKARAARQSGRLLEALEIYRSIGDTYAGLFDTSAVGRERSALESSPELAKARAGHEAAAKYETDRRERAFGTLLDWRAGVGETGFDEPELIDLEGDGMPAGGSAVTSSAGLIVKLDVSGLRRDGRAETPRGEAAQRVLASIYAQTSFYLSRDFEAQGNWEAVATLLETARAVRDDNPELHYRLASARAKNGQKKKALAALEGALEAGYTDANRLANDPEFASLRQDKKFQALLQKLKAPPSP